MRSSLNTPEVSICIVSLKGHGRLHRLLDSLQQHTSHIDYEVVIVESGSRVRDYTRRMNRALRAGAGRIIVGLNDDVEVTPNWLDPLIAEIGRGTWVCYPDQSMTVEEGNQILTGWCVVFSRDALEAHDLYYDEQFVLWASDVDLAKRLISAGHAPVRVSIPAPLKHQQSATISKPEFGQSFGLWGIEDLDRYEAKWGTRAERDKFALAAA